MFCTNCGNEISGKNFCGNCGAKVKNQPESQPASQNNQPVSQNSQPVSQYSQPASQYNPPTHMAARVHYAPGSFIEKLHGFGASNIFLTGIILFSAGNLFSIFASFGWTSFFSMLFLALPVTGFWLIFAASKAPVKPEKTLAALTLFKIAIIIDLVLQCLLGLLFLIFSIALFAAAAAVGSTRFYSGPGAGMIGFIGFMLLVIAGAVVVVGVLYFKASIKVIGGIKQNILDDTFYPLKNIQLFTILTYISVGLSALGVLASMAMTNLANSILSQLPSELRSIVQPYLGGGAPISELFTLTGLAGTIVCVIALNSFNNSLIAKNRS